MLVLREVGTLLTSVPQPLEALTEQEWPILLTLRTPRKRLHIPACEVCTPENHGEGLKLSPLGEGESHSDPGALLQVWQC